MIILYPKGTTKATANTLGEGVLTDTATCEVSEEINGKYELEMTYPINGVHYKDIELDKYIKAKVNPYEEKYQLFKIYSISKPINGIITINAQHSSYDASYVIIHPNVKNGETTFEKIKITEAVSEIENREVLINDQAKSLYTIDVTSLSDYEKTADVTFNNITSLKNVLYNSIIAPYEIEVEWDDTNATLVKKRGSDRGVVINYGKNLEDVEEQRTRENICDAIYPYYWKTTTETSSGVTYKYQELYVDGTVSTYSYNWLYKQDSASGILGKVKSLITSTLKSYIFRVSPEVDSDYSEYKNKLYLWNTYKYVDVTEIDNWELASDGQSDTNDFMDILTKIPVVGYFKTFIPTKEKMKALKSVFSLYYSLFSLENKYIRPGTDSLITTGDDVDKYRYVNQDSLNLKYTIDAAYKNELDLYEKKDQNRTNIDIYYDASYGFVDKGIDGHIVRLYKAVYIKLNNERIYCGFQKYSNVKQNNFVYLGPQEDISKKMLDEHGSYIPFFECDSDGNWINSTFINNRYLVYIHTANDSNYANTLFIPRVSDNIKEVTKTEFDNISSPTSEDIWPNKIYKVNSDDSESKDFEYRAFKEAASNYSYKIEDKAVYTYDVWTKIATTKGLDPAYPSTAGESKTKIQKALLSALDNVYYANNAYDEKADIVSYNKSYWYYNNDEMIQKDIIKLATDDSHIFVDSITNNSQTIFYTYRSTNPNNHFKSYTDVVEVEKLPDVEDATLTNLYAKSTKSGVPDYYIVENSKWLKLTTLHLKKTNAFYNDVNYFNYNTAIITNVVNAEPPVSPVNDTLYIVEDSTYDNSPFKGCIFLNKISIDNSKNYLIQPVDITSLADDYDGDLFTSEELESTTQSLMESAAKKLLDFLRLKYIKAPENDPNKIKNETTISYMHITENSSAIDMINLHKILIGDTIHVRYSKLGISSDLRVKSITYDVLNNKYTDVVLGELTETLATSVVTNNDGVSVLANDSGYANSQEVGKIIAKSIQAAYVSAETFEATNATIDNLIANMITTQQLTAIEADIENLKTESLRGKPDATGGSASSIDIVTNINEASFDSQTINYETAITVSWNATNKILSIVFNT